MCVYIPFILDLCWGAMHRDQPALGFKASPGSVSQSSFVVMQQHNGSYISMGPFTATLNPVGSDEEENEEQSIQLSSHLGGPGPSYNLNP